MMKKISIVTAGAALFALSAAVTAQAETLLDTTPPGGEILYGISPFGESGSKTFGYETYGQTFTIGSDNVLNDFTFWLNDFDDYPGVINFASYIAEWDGSKINGSTLYASEKQSTTKAPGYEQFTFKTGGLSLESGKQYVAFLSVSNFLNGILDIGAVGVSDPLISTYSGGDFVYNKNGSDFSLLFQNTWEMLPQIDAAFKASFSKSIPEPSKSVPEPGSVISLLVFGTLGASSMLKRKQQKVRVKADY